MGKYLTKLSDLSEPQGLIKNSFVLHALELIMQAFDELDEKIDRLGSGYPSGGNNGYVDARGDWLEDVNRNGGK